MKKYLLSFAVMVMGTTLLTGCLGDDSKGGDTPSEIVVTKGALVINSGSVNNSIDGSLTYFDAMTGSPNQNVYQKVNSESLGGTVNDVLTYGQKVYIVGSDENTIFVLDARTFKLLPNGKVSTTDLLGDSDGHTPRRIIAYENKVYFTTYGGYVAAIDTTKFEKNAPITLDAKYKVGSYPEGLALGGTSDNAKLYVANSDWSMGSGDISIIDIKSGNVTPLVVDKVKNPIEILAAGTTLYVLDSGHYEADGQKDAGVYRIDGNNNVKLVVPNATGMTGYGYTIYTFNNPWGSTTGVTYSAYNVEYDVLSSLSFNGDSAHPIVAPAAISIDPNTGNFYIASRPLDKETGFPSYALPGFVNIYSSTGQYIGYFDTGVEPHKIEFSYGTQKIIY